MSIHAISLMVRSTVRVRVCATEVASEDELAAREEALRPYLASVTEMPRARNTRERAHQLWQTQLGDVRRSP